MRWGYSINVNVLPCASKISLSSSYSLHQQVPTLYLLIIISYEGDKQITFLLPMIPYLFFHPQTLATSLTFQAVPMLLPAPGASPQQVHLREGWTATSWRCWNCRSRSEEPRVSLCSLLWECLPPPSLDVRASRILSENLEVRREEHQREQEFTRSCQ